MARAIFVKKARKDNSVVKKGESYYWWKFRFGGKHYSKERPRRSQLTQSGFLSQMYDIEDGIGEQNFTEMDSDAIQSTIDEFVSDIQCLLDECQESFDNMPEQLQESSSSGETLQMRIDGLEQAISDLENIDTDFEEEDSEDRREEIQQEFESICIEY